MRFCLILLVLIGTCHTQNRDWSLEEMCKYYDGVFTQRPTDGKTGVGDKCEELKIQYAVETDTMAWRLCEEMFPYHVIKATRDTTEMMTVCDVEAGLICKKDWIQLYGRCYKMEKKLMKYQDAKDHCQSWDGATIGFIHRNILLVHWKDYYTGVSKMWVEASAVIHDDLKYNTGDHMMLVLNGYHYGIKSFSLIRVNGTVDKAMVLCEYTPKMTRAESNYLIRRYSEIYYTGFSTNRGMFMRTTNHRNADNLGRKTAESKYCSEVMKPFITNAKVDSLEASSDEKEFLDELRKAENQKLTFYRSTEFIRNDDFTARSRSDRDSKDCQSFKYVVADHRNFRPLKKENMCDAGHWSHAVNILQSGSELMIDWCSEALRAPLYCQAVIGVQEYGPCPAGYIEFMRPTGVKWCHKYFPDEKTAADAEQECFSRGAHLTGFENKAELDFLIGLMKNSSNYKQNSRNDVWLGAKRREACRWGSNGGSKGWRDGQNECSRKLVFYWDHYVAGSPPNFEDSMWHSDNEPNYQGHNENCLSIMDLIGKIGLNDLPCTYPSPYICGIEATASG